MIEYIIIPVHRKKSIAGNLIKIAMHDLKKKGLSSIKLK